MRYTLLLLFCIMIINRITAQTLGGNAVFHFVQQPNTAQLSALGGVNVSSIGAELGMAFQNPALLRPAMHGTINTSFNSFVAGIRNYSLTGGWRLENANTNLAIGTNYFDYGTLMQTDAAGQVLGTFRPVDYVVQVMASHQYKERFFYGATLKYIHSGYGPYRSSGVAVDVGLNYYDSVNQFQAGITVRNMGTQLQTYDGSNRKEELPFDIQAGITKRLANAPFQFSLTLHHLQAFNTYYNDTAFRASEGEPGYANNSFSQKLASHVVLGMEIFPHEKIMLMTGYNFQRRQDLNAYNLTSGLNGFSFGAGLLLKQLQVRYATGFYQTSAFHQFSLSWKLGGFY
jgi:hypothetical protein